MNLKTSAIKGVKWTSVASVLSFSIGLFYWAIISRVYTKEEIGILGLLAVIIGLANGISDLGLSNVVIHFQKLTKSQLSTLYYAQLGFSVLVIIALYLIAPIIVDYFFKDVSRTDTVELIRISSLAIFFLALGQQFQNLLLKKLDFKTPAIIEISQKIAMLIGLIYGFYTLQIGLYAVIYATLIGAFTYAVLYLTYAFKNIYIPNPLLINFKKTKPYFQFGLYQLGSSIVGYLSTNLDKIFIKLFFGIEYLGIYEQAYRLMLKPIAFISPIFSKVALPIFSKIQDNYSLLNSWFIKQIEIITFLLFPIYFGMYALSDELVLFLCGPNWEESANTLNILWIMGLVKSISNPLGSYLVAIGKPNFSFFMNLFRLFVTVSVFLILGPILDYYTILWVFILALLLFTWPIDYYIRYYLTKMSVKKHIYAFKTNLILSFIMFLIVITVKTFLLPTFNSIVILLVSVLVGAFVYTGLSYIFNKPLLLRLRSYLQS